MTRLAAVTARLLVTEMLLVAAVVAQLLDVWTWRALPYGAEGNQLIAGMHTEAAIAAKMLLLVVVVAVQPALRPRYRAMGELVAVVAIVAGSIGAGANLSVLV